MKAANFKERAVYYPEKRPGYTAWLSLFKFDCGDLGLAFQEIRRGPNPHYKPAPLEFIYGMGLPYRFGPVAMPSTSADNITEYVYLRSSDGGATWRQTGRCPVITRHYYHAALDGDSMVRIHCRAYCGEFEGAERFVTVAERSDDGGSTWDELSRIAEGYFFYLYRLKKISNSRLIASGIIMSSFGPGGVRPTLYSSEPGIMHEVQACFFESADDGRTWDGPHYVLPGVKAYEYDFVELPDGALLCINSNEQGGAPARQIIRRQATGWVNEPMMTIYEGSPPPGQTEKGHIPESFTLTPGGLLVGARRSREYAASNDLGANWFVIGGLPRCNYQPMIESLPDGRFLAAWHYGSDSSPGEDDMYIGTHEFRLEGELPAATRLTISREMTPDGKNYINAFRAKLTANGEPTAGKKVEFRYRPHWRDDGRREHQPLDEVGAVVPAVTDAAGEARVAFPEYDRCPDVHFGYDIDAVFRPAESDAMIPCRSIRLSAPAMTEGRDAPVKYPVYMVHGMIVITPETEAQYPWLAAMIARVDGRKRDVTRTELVRAVGGDEARADAAIGLLERHGVLTGRGDGHFSWYKTVHCGKPMIKGVRVDPLRETYM